MATPDEILSSYYDHIAQRAEKNLPPKPLDMLDKGIEIFNAVVAKLSDPATPAGEATSLVQIITTQVAPGTSPEKTPNAKDIKAEFLGRVARSEVEVQGITPSEAVTYLGTQQGGQCVSELVALLNHDVLGGQAASTLENLVQISEAQFDSVVALSDGNANAANVISNWASATWFAKQPEVPEEIEFVVYKALKQVDDLDTVAAREAAGEKFTYIKMPNGTEMPYEPATDITTDAYSPGAAASSRADIPLHATFMLADQQDRIEALQKANPGKIVAIATLGDQGTGSSRLSGINSVAWNTAVNVNPHVPAEKTMPIVIGSGVAPIFERGTVARGGFPLKFDTVELETGDQMVLNTKTGEVTRNGELFKTVEIGQETIESVRSGGTPRAFMGKLLTAKAAEHLGQAFPDFLAEDKIVQNEGQGYTAAEKLIASKAGVANGVHAGSVVTARVDVVGSQDTTGPMTVQEAGKMGVTAAPDGTLYYQSQCHMAGMPTLGNAAANKLLTEFADAVGGIYTEMGDGVIHTWLNKLVPDDWALVVGGDSHTRTPLGLSFGADSLTVATAATTGKMQVDVPESVKLNIVGELPAGITQRDIVNAIPQQAYPQTGGKNPFSNAIIEMHGFDGSAELAYTFADATAERKATATINILPKERVIESIARNHGYVLDMIEAGYDNGGVLEKHAAKMQDFLDRAAAGEWEFLEPDTNAKYRHEITVDLSKITEPLLTDPNPDIDSCDNIIPMSSIAGEKVEECFLGSCMTNLMDFQMAAAILREAKDRGISREDFGARLWIAPPSIEIRNQLIASGDWEIFEEFNKPVAERPVHQDKKGKTQFDHEPGTSVEIPGCGACMGNQTKVKEGARGLSTSTRPYKDRMGYGAKMSLGSAPVVTIGAILGHVPSMDEYKDWTKGLELTDGLPTKNISTVDGAVRISAKGDDTLDLPARKEAVERAATAV